jgi:uncharacterized lipoprotein
MIKKMLVVSALASAMLSGCSTLSTAQEAKGSGMSRIYNKDYNTVWNATDEVVRNSGLSVASSNKEKGEILAESGMGAFTYGENVAVFVTELDKTPQTKVEVVNKRVLATNVTAKDWDELLLRHLDGKLR